MSSIFFDNPLPLSEGGSVRCAAWSRQEESPLLAVAEGLGVRIFREEGDEIVEAALNRGVACSSLAWHPQSKLLAAGWEDGTVTFSGPGTTIAQDNRDIHRESQILCIAFNPAGTRCVTADSGGVVGVWKTDSKGMLNQMCHYRKAGAHYKVVFRTLTPGKEPNFENPPFFFGGEQGTIFLADDFGLCSERYKIGSPLLLLEYYHQKDMVVIITKSVIMAQFGLDSEGKVINETKLKLSCGPQPEKLQGVWAGPGLLATCSHESIVRLWNLADDESYILSLQGVDERNSLAGDKVTGIDFNPRKKVLAAGTRGGRVVQWRCSTLIGTPKSEKSWEVLPVASPASNAIDKVTWGPGEALMHIRTERSSVLLSEAQLSSSACKPYLAVQAGPTKVILYHLDLNISAVLVTPFRIKGVSVGGTFVMMWNSNQVVVYEIEDKGLGAGVIGSFSHEEAPITAAVLVVSGAERSVAIASGNKVEFVNFNGNPQKQSLTFSPEVEGNPVSLDTRGGFLAVSTSHSVVRIWNVSRAQPKPMGNPRKFLGMDDKSLGEIRSVRVNVDGTRLSLLVEQRLSPGGSVSGGTSLKVPDSRIFVYDLDSDSFLPFTAGKSLVPVAHSWDCTDGRLLSCEVIPQALAYFEEKETASAPPSPKGVLGLSLEGKKEEEEPGHQVLTLFVVGSDKILFQDSISCIDEKRGGVHRMPVALVVPHIYFTTPASDGPLSLDGKPDANPITKTVLRDFAGLETVDADTTVALLDFSYHLACGNTDEAYKSVKGVRSVGVWESMSKMCVKTGRLDVAQKCLGQMGHARAASALRSCAEPEPEAKLATVAVQLDMVEDAEQLLKRCGRYDLLNQLYQACGQWDKALEVAKTKDRVHLKPTHYAYAQYLESVEDVQGALSHFELSGTYRIESLRLLCALGLTDELEAYVEQSDDPHLHRWYAQYLESKANLDGAYNEYKKARDWLSLCRVACFDKDLDKAQRICDDSQDPAACYHFARHLEAEGLIKEAIVFFQRSGRVAHAIRLAQENGLDGDLMSLALASDPVNMANAARYFEQKGQPSKAVLLYQKAGSQKKALELCFSAKLFDALRKIADDLNADSDPEVLAKCAGFFMQHKQHDKAVHLLCMSQQFQRALDLCIEHEVVITEEMAERMTPDKTQMEATARSELLVQMAKLCRKQGLFQLACKKFTQAGDKLQAMKSLLQSGDTEKIIFFAGTARQPEIYVLAGNYLQCLDWRNDPEIMKNIIQFYGKAKAYEKLAVFYDACAQVEIDEYGDYERAGGALRESLKYLIKVAGPGAENDERVIALQNKIAMVENFAVAGAGQPEQQPPVES